MPFEPERPAMHTPEMDTARRLVWIADEMARGLEDPEYVPSLDLANLSPVVLAFVAPIVTRRRAELQAEKRAGQLRIAAPLKMLPPPSAYPAASDSPQPADARQRAVWAHQRGQVTILNDPEAALILEELLAGHRMMRAPEPQFINRRTSK